MKQQLLYSGGIVITTFIFSAIIMFLMRKVAVHINAMDIPRSEEGNRHIHKKATPKLGGVGIFLSFLLGYMLFGEQSIRMNSILIGSFIIILTSIVDDITPIRAVHKFLAHIVAASVIVFYGQILLNNITAFGYSFDFGILSYPITIVFIVACTNIINLIDGLDGLSGGICSIFYITIAIIGFFQGRFGSLVMILTLIMLGATLGFLLHNFHPAKIFAGDGATFMGFIIAVITLLEFKGPALISFFAPIAILAIPILDTLFAIIRRLLKGQPPFQADKKHLHHQLLGMNLSQTVTVLIIYAVDILFALSTLVFVLYDQQYDKNLGQIMFILLFIIVVWFVLNTTIISDKNPEITKKIEEKIGIKRK